MITNLIFYAFSFLIIASSLMVISVKNPVHSVLFLIFTFFSAAGIFVILGAEFVAMVLVIVYVGAVAVLFLFVVMMLNINFAQLKSGFVKNLPMVSVIATLFLFELVLIFKSSKIENKIFKNISNSIDQQITNTQALGQLLYTQYFFIFQMAGLILFIAMVSAIILTLQKNKQVRRQNLAQQSARDPKKSIKFVDAPIGKGVEI